MLLGAHGTLLLCEQGMEVVAEEHQPCAVERQLAGGKPGKMKHREKYMPSFFPLLASAIKSTALF